MFVRRRGGGDATELDGAVEVTRQVRGAGGAAKQLEM
jgi:hypothetical protein